MNRDILTECATRCLEIMVVKLLCRCHVQELCIIEAVYKATNVVDDGILTLSIDIQHAPFCKLTVGDQVVPS